jgi:hypothetical protein
MSYRQTLSGYPAKKGFQLGFLQPAPAWIAILTLFLFTALGILAGAGKFLNVAFPAGALIVGAFLYFRYPILYIGFTWWVWFLTAFIRRLADYRSSYTEPSPLLFAPYLVMGITLVTVLRNLPKARREGNLPFILSLVAVFYSFLIGLINGTPFEVTRYFLDWLCPITFGFHLTANWRSFPSYYQNIQRTFAWGVLIMGIYGIFQFLVGPNWDSDWLVNSGMAASNGYVGVTRPGALTIRVFSTMNSVEPFGAFMAAALLLLFSKPGILNLCASGAGYLAFLLSLARSAWIGWLAGLATLASSLKLKYQMRLILILLVMALIVAPLTTMEPFSKTITARTQTLSDVQNDGSFKGRSEYLKNVISSGEAFTQFVGQGISGQIYDSALLAALFQLGWLGTICYSSGLISLIVKLFQDSEGDSNLFQGTARAVVMSCLIRLPVNGTALLGVGGLVLWSFLALNIASQKYYLYQRTIKLEQSSLQ